MGDLFFLRINNKPTAGTSYLWNNRMFYFSQCNWRPVGCCMDYCKQCPFAIINIINSSIDCCYKISKKLEPFLLPLLWLIIAIEKRGESSHLQLFSTEFLDFQPLTAIKRLGSNRKLVPERKKERERKWQRLTAWLPRLSYSKDFKIRNVH